MGKLSTCQRSALNELKKDGAKLITHRDWQYKSARIMLKNGMAVKVKYNTFEALLRKEMIVQVGHGPKDATGRIGSRSYEIRPDLKGASNA
jgi:hypothetical protein